MRKKFNLFLLLFLILGLTVSRLYKIDQSLLFFNDIGRDFLVLFRWEETGRPPLLGPQTSALPYNQSAVYFYLLFPIYWLSGYSPFATIYTALLFYLGVMIFGFFYLKNEKKWQLSYLLVFLLIMICPQLILQNRFVWNPSFVGPLIVLSFFAFEKMRKNIDWNKFDLAVFVFSIGLAVSLSYSIAPLFISYMLWGGYLFRKKLSFIKFYICSGLGLIFWNLPTLFFELRHEFLLTNLLIHGEKLSQEAIAFSRKFNDLLMFSFSNIPSKIAFFIFFLIFILTFITIWGNKKNNQLFSALILSILNLIITFLAPISIQGHYVFGFLIMFFILLSLQERVKRFFLILFFIFFWLKPQILSGYISPTYRSVRDSQKCAELVCANEKEPLFVSVQSDLHPYHNGMEFKYLFSQAGCQVKELDTQLNEANKMMVVVDHSKYDHGSTAYNELTQFGISEAVKQIKCMENLEVVVIKKI